MTIDGAGAPRSGEGATKGEARFDLVHSDTIRFFPELVKDLGGDSEALLRKAGVDPKAVLERGSILEYRAVIELFEIAATELRCADFGLRLAARQGGTQVMGPIGVAMKNSKTLGQALGYCAKQIQAYCLATRVRFVPDRTNHKLFIGLEILLDGVADRAQIVEHGLLLASLNVIDITGAAARVRQVSFCHPPLSSRKIYQDAFGCGVLFGAVADGIVLEESDLLCPVIDPDEQLYEMATSFIASHYPPNAPPMHAQVRALINRYLGGEDCTNERVAADLWIHPRTLQRRLRSEGKSFESIKGEVRRELLMRYLLHPDMSLGNVAEKLGYADQSVLTRSCYRWFCVSPRKLREKVLAGPLDVLGR